MLMIEFLFDKDLNVASQEVRDAISTIRTDLPTEMKEPIIQKFNDTDRPIVSVGAVVDVLFARRSSRDSPIPASRASCARLPASPTCRCSARSSAS